MLDEDGHSCFYRVCTHELLNPVEHDKSGLKTIRASDAGTGDCSSATSPPKSEGLCLSSSIHNVHAGSFNRGRQRTKRRHPLLLLTPLSCSSKFTLPESPLSAHASSVASPHVLTNPIRPYISRRQPRPSPGCFAFVVSARSTSQGQGRSHAGDIDLLCLSAHKIELFLQKSEQSRRGFCWRGRAKKKKRGPPRAAGGGGGGRRGRLPAPGSAWPTM